MVVRKPCKINMHAIGLVALRMLLSVLEHQIQPANIAQ